MKWWLVVLAVGVTLFLGALWALDRSGTEDTAVPSDALIILGARVEPDGVASTTLQARVEHAVALYERGVAKHLVFSGGVGDFGASEASVAMALAVKHGVPAEVCVLEEGSHSTRQNAEKSAVLLHARGWERVVLVTDPYHLPRASRLFRKQGLEVTGSPVLLAPRHVVLRSRLWWTVREVFALPQWL
jgi:uncharacterized SAM-binding protein YcdF (DUF218 family)